MNGTTSPSSSHLYEENVKIPDPIRNFLRERMERSSMNLKKDLIWALSSTSISIVLSSTTHS